MKLFFAGMLCGTLLCGIGTAGVSGYYQYLVRVENQKYRMAEALALSHHCRWHAKADDARCMESGE